jgi:uncharacterized protein YndB with AHSA1/START domain
VANPRATNTDLARFPLGTATGTGEDWRLDFVRDYPHPPERIWRSLTDPGQTRLWWAESDIDLRVGGRFNLRWLNGPDSQPMDWWDGQITVLEPPHLLEHTNSVHGVLRWQVEPTDRGTRLTFTNRITVPEKRFVTMSLAGWHAHLDHLLESVELREPDWPSWYQEFGEPWEELHTRYQAATGLP